MKIGEFVFNKETGNYGIYAKDYATDTYKVYERYLDKKTYLYKYDYVTYNNVKKLITKKMSRNEYSIYINIYSSFLTHLKSRIRILPDKLSAIEYSMEQVKEFFNVYTNELMEEFYETLCENYQEVSEVVDGKCYFCMIKYTKNKYPVRIDAKKVEYKKVTKYSFYILTSLGKRPVTVLDDTCKQSSIPIAMYESMQDGMNVYNSLPSVESFTKNCNVFTLNNLESYINDYLKKGHPLNLMRDFQVNFIQIYDSVKSFDDLARHLMSLYGDDTLDLIHVFEIPDDKKSSKFNSNQYSGSILVNDFFDGSDWNVKFLEKKGIKVRID